MSCLPRSRNSAPDALPEARVFLGEAEVYKPSAPISNENELKYMDVRRQAGWRIFQDMIKEIEIKRNPDLPVSLQTIKSPLWQTWYDSDEFERIFRNLYRFHGKENRVAKKPLCPKFYNNAFKAFHFYESKDMLKPFNRPRYDHYKEILSKFEELDEIRGILGAGKTIFSPSYIRHYLKTYNNVFNCSDDLRNEQYDPDRNYFPKPNYLPTFKSRSVCMDHEFPTGNENIALNEENFTHCGDNGPIFSFPELEESILNKPAPTDDRDWGPAVAIKVTFFKNNEGISSYKTDAETFKNKLSEKFFWPDALDKTMFLNTISNDKIYTIKTNDPVAGQDVFKLSSMHIASKELREWLWVTVWWSDKPDTDFGADRPAALKGTPWANYKMCVVTAYDEQFNPDTKELYFKDSKFQSKFPGLYASLDAAKDMAMPYTWCSNPYIEHGEGNANTNCIGCHQHGGDPQANFDTIHNSPDYPANGKQQLRHDFPTDYTWSSQRSPDFYMSRIKKVIEDRDARDQ